MALGAIPVHLVNPGQVFACVGFLEAADVLYGGAAGRFEGAVGPHARFVLEAAGGQDPFRGVLEALSAARVEAQAPPADPWSEVPSEAVEVEGAPGAPADSDAEAVGTFPAAHPERMALPLRLVVTTSGVPQSLTVGHFAEGDTGRDNFKLYAGNRSGRHIAEAMLHGARDHAGRLKTPGLAEMWKAGADTLARDPFGALVPMGGSFNLDPRGAWTAMDAGYSPNLLSHAVAASPVVEILAAMGLEHARPWVRRSRVRYGVWGDLLPPILARPALGAADVGMPLRTFGFTLASSGKNRVVTFSEEEMRS